MTTILLIRHGESEANKQRIFAGHINPALTEKGQVQAKITAEFIQKNYRVDAVYASDLQRAYDTASALAVLLDLPVTPDTRLREINAGKWENVKFDELPTMYPEDYLLWQKQIGKAVCTGGESVEQLSLRFMQALTQIAQKNDSKTVAVASHATPIRTAQCLIQAGALSEMNSIPWVSNASVTEITYDNGIWRLIAASQDSHLEQLCTALPNNV